MEKRIWLTYLFPMHLDEALIFSDIGDILSDPQRSTLARAKWQKTRWKRSSIYRAAIKAIWPTPCELSRSSFLLFFSG